MSLQQCWKQSYRASVPQNFLPNWLEHRVAVERSLFEPAEHRQVRRETDSEYSQSLPEPKFQAEQFDSPVAIQQRRVPTWLDLQGLEAAHVAGLPPVKNPAHQPERQPVLVFGFHGPVC